VHGWRCRWPWLAAALLPIFACAPAAAVEFCVGTVAELDAALIVAGSATGQTTTIKLKQGTWHVGASRLLVEHGYNAMKLLGGYNADCSVRSLVASNTVIDGGGGYFHGMTLFGDLTIEGLRFQNLDGIAHALFLYASTDAENVVIKVRNNEFRGIGVVFSYFDPDGGAVGFSNNLVVDAPMHGVWLQFNHDDVPTAGVVGNTIVNSADKGIFAQTTTDYLNLYNNVVWNSATRDIWIEEDAGHNPGSATFRNNLYDGRLGDEGPGSGGTLHDDPLFAGVGNYRLQASSPAVNSGTTAIAMSDVDLDGHARVIGSTVDRGAYEAIVDDTVPTQLTVTHAGDSGSGSLRQAILDANANPDFSFIDFDIAGACPRRIALSSALPTITQGVRIDAYSQPGSAANTRSSGDNATRCIVLDGGGAIGTGLEYGGGSATQFWLQGIAIEGFTSAGLRLVGGSDALVWGNQFGGTLAGQPLAPNGSNIVLTLMSWSASIGGDAPAQRNVIAGATGIGIEVRGSGFFHSSDNLIAGNLIGTHGNELDAAGNGTGVRIATAGNTIRDNIIVNSAGDGVLMEGAGANGNLVERNSIGRIDLVCIVFPQPQCFDDSAPNLRHGVRIAGGAHDNVVSRNMVWNSAQMGISVAGAGHGNRLSANSVYDNDGWGIDLDGSGLNDNDAAAAAQDLPNRGLNYPLIVRAYGGSRRGVVEGTLDSTADSYQIQVFTSALPDNQPNGEGEVFLRSGVASIFSAPPGQNGSTSFRIAIESPSGGFQGRSFALTAIDSSGNTSEFSYSQPYRCDVVFRNGFDDAEDDACAAE
jgi:parallel beta-helix repeat protein